MKLKILLSVGVVAFVILGISTITSHSQKLKTKEIQLKSTSTELNQIKLDYQILDKKQETLLKDKNTSQQQLEEVKKQKEELDKKNIELQKQVQLKQEAQRLAAERLSKPAQAVTGTKTAYAAPAPSGAVSGNCGDNPYKQYIYQHESGCRTNARNPIGCYGIGQACPASKIAHCGDNFACQDAWFSNYAQQRYGGWAGAYAFWLRNHYW